MTTTPEYAKGGAVSRGMLASSCDSAELVGAISTHCRTGADKLLPAIVNGYMQCSDWHETEVYKQMMLEAMQGGTIRIEKPETSQNAHVTRLTPFSVIPR